MRVLQGAVVLVSMMLGVLAAWPAVGATPTFTAVDLGTLGGTNTSPKTNGINDAGDVIGTSHTASQAQHDFFYDGSMHDLTLGGASSGADAMNASGQVVGHSLTAGGQNHAFFFSAGTTYDLNALAVAPAGYTLTEGYAINNAGVVAVAGSNGTQTREFLFDTVTHALTDVGTLGGINTSPKTNGINNAGSVIGTSHTVTQAQHDFFFDGTIHDLTLGGTSSGADALNNANQVVGRSLTASGQNHGFFYSGGTTYDLNTLASAPAGYTLTEGYAINDAGLIAVAGTNGTQTREFLFDSVTHSLTDVGTLGGINTSPKTNGINGVGDVIGTSHTSTQAQHDFFYDGTIHDLTLGGTFSGADAMNDAGQAVGFALTAAGKGHAFLYDGGVTYDLNALTTLPAGYVLGEAYGINANGQIIAAGSNGTQTREFLLSPAISAGGGGAGNSTPLPRAAWAGVLLLAGLWLAKRWADGRGQPA